MVKLRIVITIVNITTQNKQITFKKYLLYIVDLSTQQRFTRSNSNVEKLENGVKHV